MAQYTVEKLLELGAKPVTLSDSDGFIYDEAGIDREKLAFVMELKNVRRGRIKEYADKFKGAVYTPLDPKLDHNPLWNHQGRLRLPERDPERDQRQGRRQPAEERRLRGRRRRQHADRRSTASTQFLDARDPLRPGQGRQRRRRRHLGPGDGAEQHALGWTREEVDDRLHQIMKSIHKACVETAERFGTPGNYVNGANIAGFLKVADAMMDQGLV